MNFPAALPLKGDGMKQLPLPFVFASEGAVQKDTATSSEKHMRSPELGADFNSPVVKTNAVVLAFRPRVTPGKEGPNTSTKPEAVKRIVDRVRLFL